MNLACLLMTLVCLITILLFSGSNANNNNSNPVSRVIPRKSLFVDEMQGGNTAESIDSLDSQPLVGSATSQQQTVSANSNNDNLNFLDNRRDGAKFRRKSELSNSDENSLSGTTNSKSLTNEREIEDLASNINNSPELPEKGDSSTSSDKQAASIKSEFEPNSLIDPILSQIFNDSEIGTMLKQALKKASNGTATSSSGGGFNKPIIRRSKNGATIIISSSSTFNNNNSLFNNSSSPFPSLIEKLLPPMFRPLSLGSDLFLKQQQTADGNVSSNSSNPQAAGLASSVATITINSEPIFASSSSPFGISRGFTGSSNPFASFLAATDPFSPLSQHYNHNSHHHPHHHDQHHPHHHHHHASRLPGLFMEPLAFRAPTPFGPPSLFGSPFAAMSGPMSGPPGLMSMIIRANQLDQADEDSTQTPPPSSSSSSSSSLSSTSTSSKSQRTANERDELNAKNNNDALKAQASQQQNLTTGKRQSTDKLPATAVNNNDSEVETLDMSEFIPARSSPSSGAFTSRLHNFYPQRSIISKPSGSMVIFSSGNLGTSPARNVADPFGFPFMSPSAISSPFSPFMPPSISPPPQMMFLGGENGAHGGNGAQMLNPILRSFLNNVMSDIVPLSSSIIDADQTKDTNNKTGLNERNDKNNSLNKATRSSSSSNLNPSWTALSSAELEDDWTNGGASEGTIDRWDEQNPPPSSSNKHIRAHHRSDEGNDPNSSLTESSEGIQFEQQNPSPFERHLGPSFSSSGNFLSPSLTVEKLIETPARIQHIGSEIRSQSLSRADFEEPNESTATLSRPFQPTSPFFPPRSITSSSQSNNDDFAPHVGFISRLLNDISRRSDSTTNKQTGSSSIIKNRSMEDDFDEGDSSSMNENVLVQSNNNKHHSQDNAWPKIRVASARIRMRPINDVKTSPISGPLMSPNSDAIFMSPNHFTFAENSDIDKESQVSSLEPNKPSFDDTMNSMEDRLNHVLSLASHQTFLPNHKQSSVNEEQQTEAPSKPQSVPAPQALPSSSSSPPPSQAPQSLALNNARAAVEHSIPLPQLVSSRSEPKQHNQVVEEKQHKPTSDNPFTSPSSPLFGFPASSLAQNDLQKVPKPSQELNNNDNNNNNSQQIFSNRQPRSFTYHSNNEVATSLANLNATPRAVDQMIPAASTGRSRFIPLSGPPASVVMGRRLDDGPFSNEQSLISLPPPLNLLGDQQRQQQQKSVAPSRSPDVQNHASNSATDNRHIQQSTFNSAPINNIASQNENYRTIVV